MKSEDYWAQRALALEDNTHRQADEFNAGLQKAYNMAEYELQRDIDAWYQRFADDNAITMADAKRLLSGNELEEFRWSVQEYIQHGEGNWDEQFTAQLKNAGARVHVSRLEALQLQLQRHVETLISGQAGGMESLLHNAYADRYNHTAFEVGNAYRVDTSFAMYDERQLERALRRPWAADASNWSERVWKNRQGLSSAVQTGLAQGIIRGDHPRALADSLKRQFEVSRSAAARLAYTEASHIAEEASKDAYKDLGVKAIQLLCTLDNTTCTACGSLDGEILRQTDMMPGISTPPFHPNCRCTTIPYFADEDGYRAARGDEGEVYHVPGDETYEQWLERVEMNRQTRAWQEAAKEKAEQDLHGGAKGGIIPVEMRIPQFPASSIWEKVDAGEYSLKLSHQQYLKHAEGTVQYESYRASRAQKDRPPQSILTVSAEEAQRIIKEQAGTGIILPKNDGTPSHKEQINCGKVIGKCWSGGEYRETTKATIHYGKRGAHIVPLRSDRFD